MPLKDAWSSSESYSDQWKLRAALLKDGIWREPPPKLCARQAEGPNQQLEAELQTEENAGCCRAALQLFNLLAASLI